MESIGKKIRRIRTEKGYSQMNLYPDNQSAISQIESERNQNPTSETLRIIAKNMGITFEELVKDTSWKNSRKSNTAGKYAYSQLDFTLHLNVQGQIKIVFQNYDLYDENGLENKYCPVTAVGLISECFSCKKPIVSAEQIYCMGCGEKIFMDYKKSVDEISTVKPFVQERLYKKKIDIIIKKLENDIGCRTYKSGFVYKEGDDGVNFIDLRPETIKEGFNNMFSDENQLMSELGDSFLVLGVPWKNKWKLDDYLEGVNSKNPDMALWHKEQCFKEIYCRKLIEELKTYRSKIDDIQITGNVVNTEFSDNLIDDSEE